MADIAVQLDVFDEQRECDEAQSLQRSHLDVFSAILGQVADTPQEIPFLSILQHLLRIDPKEPISDIIWDTTETLVHRATLLENLEDSSRLLRAPSVQKFTCPHCHRGADNTSPSRKQSLAQTSAGAPSAPPPPPIAGFASADGPAPPPPPPMPMMMSGGKGSPGLGSFSATALPPPAPPPAPSLLSAKNSNDASAMNRPKTPDVDPAKLLPQQETPVPKTKMKTINWNKIPMNKVMGRTNIWTIVANSHVNSPMTELDWNEMEGLFCQQATSAQGSPKMSRDSGGGNGNGSGYDTLDRKSKKESSEVSE